MVLDFLSESTQSCARYEKHDKDLALRAERKSPRQ